MKTNVTIVFVLLAALLYGCGNGNTNEQISKEKHVTKTDSTKVDTLDQLVEMGRPEVDILYVFRKTDTLTLVLGWPAYYPFGKLKTAAQLKSINPIFQFKEERYLDDVSDSVTLNRLFSTNSFVKFYFNTETGYHNVVSAKIADKEISVYKNIHLGISLGEFVDVFFSSNINEFTNDIKVIEIISGLDGVWQYYDFKDNKLSSIRFDSDYILNKD